MIESFIIGSIKGAAFAFIGLVVLFAINQLGDDETPPT